MAESLIFDETLEDLKLEGGKKTFFKINVNNLFNIINYRLFLAIKALDNYVHEF